jgi:hypothetical protein
MGLGIDLEAATADEPYHAMKADKPKTAASGRNRRGSCSASSPAITATVAGLAVLAIIVGAVALTYRPEPSYSVEICRNASTSAWRPIGARARWTSTFTS